MDPFFSREGVMFEGCKLQTWPEQLLFHEVEKSDEHFPLLCSIAAVPQMRTKFPCSRKRDGARNHGSKGGLL